VTINFDIPALDHIATFLAQLVEIQAQRLHLEKTQMTIDDSVVQQLVDALNAAVLSETGEATLAASLQAQLAPNPTLLASVTTALANAAAATPPAAPVVTPPVTTPPVVDPNAPVAVAPVDPFAPAAPAAPATNP
jgi:pyruvate dehydrogenase E2 component (dihydrolipoamide acetyltransferase)